MKKAPAELSKQSSFSVYPWRRDFIWDIPTDDPGDWTKLEPILASWLLFLDTGSCDGRPDPDLAT